MKAEFRGRHASDQTIEINNLQPGVLEVEKIQFLWKEEEEEKEDRLEELTHEEQKKQLSLEGESSKSPKRMMMKKKRKKEKVKRRIWKKGRWKRRERKTK
ncbi:hypothetical protein R1flu_004313 [Riccia fluitans]|uniref:Uncharacterized protein n=1 Tax=Riccia fluitans TaxID=41844 RepID=A0ABD1YQW9_9MARC